MINALPADTLIQGINDDGGRYTYKIVTCIARGGSGFIYKASKFISDYHDPFPVIIKEYIPIDDTFYRSNKGIIVSDSVSSDWLDHAYQMCKRELENGKRCTNGHREGVSLNHFIKVYDIFLDAEHPYSSISPISPIGIMAEMDELSAEHFHLVSDLFETIKGTCEKAYNNDKESGFYLNLNKNGFSVYFAVSMIKEVLRTLEKINNNGYVHGDIHNNNILFSDIRKPEYTSGPAIFLDFYSASIIPSYRSKEDVFTTRGYIPPEARNDFFEWSISSDIYQVGCWSYYLLTNKLTSEKNNTRYYTPKSPDILFEDLRSCYDDREASDDIIASLTDVIMCATARSPKERYQNANEFLEALDNISSISYKRTQALVQKIKSQHELEDVNNISLDNMSNNIKEMLDNVDMNSPESIINALEKALGISIYHNATGYNHIDTFIRKLNSILDDPFFIKGEGDKWDHIFSQRNTLELIHRSHEDTIKHLNTNKNTVPLKQPHMFLNYEEIDFSNHIINMQIDSMIEKLKKISTKSEYLKKNIDGKCTNKLVPSDVIEDDFKYLINYIDSAPIENCSFTRLRTYMIESGYQVDTLTVQEVRDMFIHLNDEDKIDVLQHIFTVKDDNSISKREFELSRKTSPLELITGFLGTPGAKERELNAELLKLLNSLEKTCHKDEYTLVSEIHTTYQDAVNSLNDAKKRVKPKPNDQEIKYSLKEIEINEILDFHKLISILYELKDKYLISIITQSSDKSRDESLSSKEFQSLFFSMPYQTQCYILGNNLYRILQDGYKYAYVSEWYYFVDEEILSNGKKRYSNLKMVPKTIKRINLPFIIHTPVLLFKIKAKTNR